MILLTLNFWTIVIPLLLGLLTMIIISYGLADLKKKRWNNDYILLKALIKDSKVDIGAYDIIAEEFTHLECWNEAEQDAIKKLWFDFQERYINVSPYKIT